MEPVTTTAMIGTVVGYLSKKLKDNKSVQDFFSDFTSAAVKWIRPLFLTDDDKPKEILQNLQNEPTEKLYAQSIENALAIAVKKDPVAESHLKSMYEVLQEKAGKGESISIVNSKNVNTGSINAGSTVIIGDNNNQPNHLK